MLFKARQVNRKFDLYLLGFMLVITAVVIIPLSQIQNRMLLYLVIALMGGLVLYIYYLIRAIRTLTYGIEDEGIRINYGYKRILILWNRISGVEQQAKIKWMKFAGSEWPGNYTGYFKEFGKDKLIAAYATSREDVVVINTPKLKYVINPEDMRLFLDCINQKDISKTVDISENVTENLSLWKSRAGSRMLILNLVAILAVVAIIQSMAASYEQIPMHYNLKGEIDRYGSPYELYLMLSGTVIVLPIIIYISSKMHRAGIKEAASYLWISLGLTIFMGIVILSMIPY